MHILQCIREQKQVAPDQTKLVDSLGAQGAGLDGVVPEGKRYGGVNLL